MSGPSLGRAGCVGAAVGALLVLTGCGPSGQGAASEASSPAASSSPADSSPSSALAPGRQPAQLAGTVTVRALPYPLPGTTGYQTSVAFEAENPQNFPVISPYRVTVSGGGQVVDTTDGSDQVVLAPHQRLLVVSEPSDVEGTVPDSATVTFYGNEAGMLELPDPAGWQLTNVTGPNCNTGLVGCEVNADLTYVGTVSEDARANVSVSTVAITFNRGDEIVFAGSLHSSSSFGALTPGQPVPVTGYVVGDESAAAGLDLQ